MTWKPWKQQGNLGLMLLGLWLIATGALPLLHITFQHSGLIMAILAIVAGVLILIGR
jgi:hypothetical protein